MQKSIYDFELQLSVSIPDTKAAMKALNMFWLNDENCNKHDENGIIVAKYPDHKNIAKLTNSHYSANGCSVIEMKMGMDKNGNIFCKKARIK